MPLSLHLEWSLLGQEIAQGAGLTPGLFPAILVAHSDQQGVIFVEQLRIVFQVVFEVVFDGMVVGFRFNPAMSFEHPGGLGVDDERR